MIKRLLLFLLIVLSCFDASAATTQTPLATDTFVRANATTLGQNWTNFQNYDGNNTVLCKITSNAAAVTSVSSNCQAMYSANDFPNDQYAQTIVTRVAVAGNNLGMPCVDAVPNLPGGTLLNVNTNAISGYCVWTDGSNHYNINITKNGTVSSTQLATSSTAIGTGDTVLLTVQQVATGRQLTLFVNGTQALQTTDTANTYVTGFPAMFLAVDATITDLVVTNFVAGAVSTPPTIVNLANVPVTAAAGSAPLLLGNVTATGQAVQFTASGGLGGYSSGTTRQGSFTSLGRLQVIANGQVSNPIWVLECSQDGGSTWFQMPMVSLPSLSPQLQDAPTGYSFFYDISGLVGAQFRFGLAPSTTTTVTGQIAISVLFG